MTRRISLAVLMATLATGVAFAESGGGAGGIMSPDGTVVTRGGGAGGIMFPDGTVVTRGGGSKPTSLGGGATLLSGGAGGNTLPGGLIFMSHTTADDGSTETK